MGKYFGTDGFRGEANRDLTARHSYRIGRFLGWYFSREGPGRVVIGKDTRRSGYMLESSLVAGLTSSGADAWMLHVATTPCVSHVTRAGGFDCGIMITASHNPFYDNGIKLINANGEKMEDDLIGQLEAYLDAPEELPLPRGMGIGRRVDFAAGRKWYLDHLLTLGPRSMKGMKVGLDCANGAAWKMAGAVFGALGAQTHVIHAQPDGCNINRGAGSTHMEGLRQLVVDQGLDVGFAYDGDGDRCLCVDERGNIVTGDHILYICARYMKERGLLTGNQVVTTVMSNFGLWEAFDRLGIRYAKTPVGDRYVSEYLTAHGGGLGGEASGHIMFPAWAATGDGILTSLKVMEVILQSGKTLGELCEGLVICPQILENVPVTDRTAALEDPDVLAAIAAVEARLGTGGRILVRASGTEPVIRVMAEAGDKKLCQTCVAQIIHALMEKGYTP